MYTNGELNEKVDRMIDVAIKESAIEVKQIARQANPLFAEIRFYDAETDIGFNVKVAKHPNSEVDGKLGCMIITDYNNKTAGVIEGDTALKNIGIRLHNHLLEEIKKGKLQKIVAFTPPEPVKEFTPTEPDSEVITKEYHESLKKENWISERVRTTELYARTYGRDKALEGIVEYMENQDIATIRITKGKNPNKGSDKYRRPNHTDINIVWLEKIK